MPQCLITGCELHSPTEGWWVHGDLFRIGTSYVFNAVLNEMAEANKQYGNTVPSWKNVLTIDGQYWEKRGVFVIPILNAELNQVAKDYVEKWANVS